MNIVGAYNKNYPIMFAYSKFYLQHFDILCH